MADCKWINTNGGNWSLGSNWSTGSAPTASDNAIIDADSFSADGKTITIDATANCLNFDCSAADQNFTLANAAYNFNVYGNLVLSTKLSVSFTGTGYLNFKSTSSGKTITSNGNTSSWNRIYFDGVGGEWTNQDDWTTSNSGILLKNGHWNTNSKTISVFEFSFLSGTKVLTFGSSTIYVTNGGLWHINSDNTTVNAGTSNLVMGGQWYPCPATYYNATVSILTMGYKAGNIIFNSLTVNLRIGFEQYDYSVTVNASLIFRGANSTTLRAIASGYIGGVSGGRRIILGASALCASVSSNIDFRDITMSGGAANERDFSAITGGSGDCGGNSGITFTTAQKQYFKHTMGAVNWSDATKWFSDESPRTTAGRVPLPQDDVQFDAASFTDSSTLTVNVPRIGRSLDMSAVNQAVTVILTVNVVECYGSITLNNSLVVISQTVNYLSLLSRSTNYLDFGNTSIACRLSIVYGIFIFTNSLNYTNNGASLAISSSGGGANVDFNNQSINLLGGLFVQNPQTIKFSGVITAPAIFVNGYVCSISIAVNTHFIISGLGSDSNFNFARTGNQYNLRKVTVNSSLYFFDFLSCNYIFDELIINPMSKVRFTAGTIHQIGKLTAVGTQANPITIGSVTNAQHTLNFTGIGYVQADYLNLSYSAVTPSSKWYAGKHSVNSGNNSGWIFGTVVEAISNLTGEGSLLSQAQKHLLAEAILTGQGIITSEALKEALGIANMIGEASFDSEAQRQTNGLINLSVESILSSEAIRYALAESNLAIDSVMQSFASKLVFAESYLQADIDIVASVLKVLLGSSSMAGSIALTADALKVITSELQLSVANDLQALATKEARAEASLFIEALLLAQAYPELFKTIKGNVILSRIMAGEVNLQRIATDKVEIQRLLQKNIILKYE